MSRSAFQLSALRAAVALLGLSAGCAATQQEVVRERQLGVTGASQALARVTSDPVDEQRPAISPDGTILLLDTSVYDSAGNWTQRTIVGVDPDSGARRTLYTSTNSYADHPAWLHDGSSFVFSSNAPGGWSIVRALSRSPGSGITVIVPSSVARNASFPDVSPDNVRVALSFDGANNVAQIGVVGLDGTRFTMLGEGSSPRWSPDGKRLAFHRSVNGANQVFIADADTGSNLVQVTSGEENSSFPSYSPDGSYLVFSSNRGYKQRPGCGDGDCYNLFIVRPDGTTLTQLTDGDSDITHPVWGRDGWIYFSAGRRGVHDIWRLRPVMPDKKPTP